MTLRVLILTQWFEPEPSFKGLSFAKALRDLGMNVSVVTGFPNYPGGKIYPGYSLRWRQREVMDGISILRVPIYPSHDRSVIRRIFNYLSFAASSFIYSLVYVRGVDVIYAYHPPLSVGMAAILLKWFRGWRVVLDIQDLWPDTLRATGMVNNTALLNFIGKLAKWIYGQCDHLIVLSDGFRQTLINRGVLQEKIDVIHNWADESKLNKEISITLSDIEELGKFTILFAGNLGSAQALDTVISAAQILSDAKSRVRFVFLGTGLELDSLKSNAISRGLSNVIFMPPVPMESVGSYLRAADALLVHLRDDELFKITIPSKTQAYMAVGKPILMAVRGDAASLISEAQCGVLALPQDAHSLAQAADHLASLSSDELISMGDRGEKYYNEKLSLKVGAKRFKKVFENVLSKN